MWRATLAGDFLVAIAMARLQPAQNLTVSLLLTTR